MYCTRCGAKITDQARFCTSCGAPVGADTPPAGSAGGSTLHDAEAVETGEANPPTPETEKAKPTRSRTFSETLDSSKKKSRRRIPLIVLVALSLALFSGIAYAAYQVYTHYFAPAPQDETAVVEAPAEESSDSAEGQTNPEREAAMAAYEEVLAQYRAILGMGRDEALAALVDGEYPLVNSVEIQDGYYDGTVFEYCYEDLDGNGVEELLIGNEVTDPEMVQEGHANSVTQGYTYSNGELLQFLQGWSRNTYALCDGDVFFNHGSGSYDTGVNGYYAFDGATLSPVETISWEPQSPASRGDGALYVVKHYVDGAVTESVVPFEDIPYDGFDSTRQERADLAWQDLQEGNAS